MNLIDLAQGSPEWHTHRAQHFNASETAAMLGISPYKTRDQLLREKATGIAPEVDEAKQRRFEEGHRFEALARPIAETAIGTELYPCVGVLEGTKLSASFDGLTMDGDIVWEHKRLNETLRNIQSAGNLPEHYRAQMEQHLLVSGAEKALFTATAWDEDGNLCEQIRLWYSPDPALRQCIIDGWTQFEKDLAEYQPEPLPVPKPAGRAPELLPALHVQVTGQVLASNITAFKQQAFAVLETINRDLQTDEDFADAESTIKWCKQAEAKIAATKNNVQGQMVDVDAVLRTLDEVSSHTRNIRLELDKLVRVEKENRKLELVHAADNAIFHHCLELDAKLLAHSHDLGFECSVMPTVETRKVALAAAIKGMRSLESMQSALNAVVAEQKIAADAQYRRIETNIGIAQTASAHLHLLPDLHSLIQTKAADDLKATIAARVAAHEQKERERLEAERERIRAEEAARLEREAREQQVKETPATLPYSADKVRQTPEVNAANHSEDNLEMVKLGEINAAIAPLSITADGLAQLGFPHVSTDRAAKLYRAADFPRLRQTLIQHLAGAQRNPIDQQAA